MEIFLDVVIIDYGFNKANKTNSRTQCIVKYLTQKHS